MEQVLGAGTQREQLRWPDDMVEELPKIVAEELLETCRTFPTETGLGWGQWHPSVIERLSHSTLLLLVAILIECGKTGKWPAGIALVLIALLPKSDGGFRPIGTLPTPPRICMRARRKAARRLEELNPRPWLYAGKGKGANVAACKQAFFPELAAIRKTYVAFDKVPLWLLILEAIALGYPLRLLRLSIATYQLKRVIRVGSVIPKVVMATTGITAGSGFATEEMRLVTVRVIDRALTLFPTITPTLFVDDLVAEVCAPARHARRQMGGQVQRYGQ